MLTWNEILATQLSGSSTKESDSEIPEVVRLKKEVLIKKSQQRVQQIKRKDKDATDKKKVKYRPDGKFEKIKKDGDGKESNRQGKVTEKKRGGTQGMKFFCKAVFTLKFLRSQSQSCKNLPRKLLITIAIP